MIGDAPKDFVTRNFISSDPPVHGPERRAAAPAVAPLQLGALEAVMRRNTAEVLDALPRGETFNWVEHVSIELTTRMLAVLFDFPFEERHLLPYWSDVATSSPRSGNMTVDQTKRQKIMMEYAGRFAEIWRERAKAAPRQDFISLLAHNPARRDLVEESMHLLGTMNLLIIGGNDTTRNSMSGGVLAMNRVPAEMEKLKANPELIPNMVGEIIRWQTPLAHMRRTALEDTELGGKRIAKGEKVVMWYISGNRDEAMFENADAFVIDRPNARNHIAFGFGIHRCLGNRVAERQLRILWEEILKRFERIELMGAPERVLSNFVMGYSNLPVRRVA